MTKKTENTEAVKSDKKEEKPKTEETLEETKTTEEEITEEEAEKAGLPFPMAPIVRLMKKNMDDEKMIKKDVKIAMNKWLGHIVKTVAKEMNKFPYVMMHIHEFEKATEKFRKIQEYEKEKERILAHMEAIKKDIERLERDLGKAEDDIMNFE